MLPIQTSLYKGSPAPDSTRALVRQLQHRRPFLHSNRLRYRLLPPFYGPLKSDLPHLRSPDEPCLRGHLPWTASHIRYPDWRILAYCIGTYRDGSATAGRRRCLWLSRDFGRLVDFFCSNARFCRFPNSDPRGRHQPLDHSLERACQAEGTLPGLNIVDLRLFVCQKRRRRAGSFLVSISGSQLWPRNQAHRF